MVDAKFKTVTIPEEKYEALKIRWEKLKEHLEAEVVKSYCAQCSAGYRESVTRHINREALCKELLSKMKELENDA